jgi:hypothetical protein
MKDFEFVHVSLELNYSNNSMNLSHEETKDEPQNEEDFKSYIQMEKLPNLPHQRGFFSQAFIPVGTLLLAEIPWIVWPSHIAFDTKEGLAECIVSLCCDDEIRKHVIGFLFPQSVEVVQPEDFVRIRELLNDEIPIIQEAIVHSGAPAQSVEEIERIALVIQHNAFSSGLYIFFVIGISTLTLFELIGLYKQLSIFNHSCRPNCIKFAPNRLTNASGLL